MNFKGRNITLHDMCLRDGMHPKQHQITVDEMVDIAGALDAAGVPLIEVTHGDGLGGASVNYGFPAPRHWYGRSLEDGSRLRRENNSRSNPLHRSQRLAPAH